MKKPSNKKVEDVHMVEYATLQNLDSKPHTECSPEPPPIPAYAEDLLSEPGQSKMNLYSPILICPYTYSYLATTQQPTHQTYQQAVDPLIQKSCICFAHIVGNILHTICTYAKYKKPYKELGIMRRICAEPNIYYLRISKEHSR